MRSSALQTRDRTPLLVVIAIAVGVVVMLIPGQWALIFPTTLAVVYLVNRRYTPVHGIIAGVLAWLIIVYLYGAVVLLLLTPEGPNSFPQPSTATPTAIPVRYP